MGKALIITEKPSVAKDISEALGGFENKNKGEYYESDNFVCTYAVGHILGLLAPEDIDPKFKRWRLADLPIIPEKFDLKPLEGQKQRVKVIEKLMGRDDIEFVINACDAAREGELIFREVYDFLTSKKPIKRLWLQSMTKNAIREGFKTLSPGEKYGGLAAAAACRSQSDWLIGMNATRALTVRLKTRNERGSSWSAGRVQTPTLAILVKRELEILSHKPIPYCKIEGTFKADTHEYVGTWIDPNFKRDDDPDKRDDRIFDKSRVEKILKSVEGRAGVASETRRPKPRKAPLLFDLTSLQRDANRRFGWSAVRTLRAAQRCYEAHKVLTYPRTSSRVLPEEYREVVNKLFETFQDVPDYAPFAKHLSKAGIQNDKLIFNDEGVTDHFAIIPTGEVRNLEGDDRKLFDLVTRQFFAAFYPPAIYEEVERTTVVADQHFRSKPPMVLKEAGWQAVFEKEIDPEARKAFPPLIAGKDSADGVSVKTEKVESADHQTKPPARIGEAGLLGLMENAGRQVEDEELAQALQKAEGLGTAATRADIIENLKIREYVDQGLRPTVKGIRLIDVLERINAATMTSPALTARLELHLNEVEYGKRTAKQFMDEIKDYTVNVIDATRNFNFEDIYPDKDALGECPKCKGPVYERAWFYGCTEATKRSEEKKNCDFLIWKDFYGRYMDRATVAELLKEKKTGELDGFKSQNGKSYKAYLSLEKTEIVRKMVEGSESDEGSGPVNFEVNPAPLGPCPIHKDTDCQVVETPSEFICSMRKAKRDANQGSSEGLLFPRLLCRREMKREELADYLTTGVTAYFGNFISKKGRPFSARLKLQPNGGFVFEFPERKPAAKKGKAAAKDESEAPAEGAGT